MTDKAVRATVWILGGLVLLNTWSILVRLEWIHMEMVRQRRLLRHVHTAIFLPEDTEDGPERCADCGDPLTPEDIAAAIERATNATPPSGEGEQERSRAENHRGNL